MTTIQARELRAILGGLGIPTRRPRGQRYTARGVVHVRTDGDGRRGFGWAYTVAYDREGNEALAERADLLVEAGCAVSVFERDGRPVVTSVRYGGGVRPGARTVDLGEEGGDR